MEHRLPPINRWTVGGDKQVLGDIYELLLFIDTEVLGQMVIVGRTLV